MATTITLKKIYDELQELKASIASKYDLDSLLETQAVLANPDTMRQLAASQADKRAGRTIAIKSVRDLL
jgi:PHD/YefM family antitoxin component YafN of YafNO toxin-antitoxin module